ncbi:Uncharacterized protein GBIM_05691 [Gryllus bimaculatus]|nr:Uncharacterized protein GBIM_05691 [Gryllus bimaculatus]
MLRNTAGDEGSGDGDRGGREHIRARPHHRRAAAAAAAAAYGTALAAAPPGTDGVLAWTRADVEELRSKHLLTSNSYFAGASSNMAIPFVLPSDQEAEQDYRLLNRLLLDLYDVVRQILLRQRILRQPDDNGDSDNARRRPEGAPGAASGRPAPGRRPPVAAPAANARAPARAARAPALGRRAAPAGTQACARSAAANLAFKFIKFIYIKPYFPFLLIIIFFFFVLISMPRSWPSLVDIVFKAGHIPRPAARGKGHAAKEWACLKRHFWAIFFWMKARTLVVLGKRGLNFVKFIFLSSTVSRQSLQMSMILQLGIHSSLYMNEPLKNIACNLKPIVFLRLVKIFLKKHIEI